MATRSASWSRPADGRPAALAALVATGVFLAAWWGLHHDFFLHAEISDVPLYRDYGEAMERGLVPYRDFGVEYPPAALPFFALPAIARAHGLGSYGGAFEALIWACGAAALLGMASALRSLRAVYIDAGKRDDYYLDLGALAFHRELAKIGVRDVFFELFDDRHGAIEYRYPIATRFLAERLSP